MGVVRKIQGKAIKHAAYIWHREVEINGSDGWVQFGLYLGLS